jgi:HAE1 family hydrophobic/amphiphilic exporter-1
MMALILSVGFVVDDAIVIVLENIFRHMEQGKRPLVASLVGSREIGFTIVSMTLSLAAVFIPVLFMGGILGRLFREFSVTICVSILISGLVSVTLTPMLCSRFLRAPGHGQHSWFYLVTERFFEGMLRVYDRTLTVVLRHRPATMVTSVLVLAGTLYLVWTIPKGFIPDQDESADLITEAQQGTSFYLMARYQQMIADIVRQNPNVEALMATVGGTSSSTLGGPNFGQMLVRLKPRNQRKELVNDIINELRPKLAAVPGMKVYLQNTPTIQIAGKVTKTLYQVALVSHNKPELYDASDKLMKAIAAVPGIDGLTRSGHHQSAGESGHRSRQGGCHAG